MALQLEHVNVTVKSVDRTVEFLRIAFPNWVVRGEGPMSGDGWTGRWLHLGTDDEYVSINDSDVVERLDRDGMRQTGINHVGFIVEDAEAVQVAMDAAGFDTSMAEVHRFRKRLYVTDADGITWEFVEYMSDVPAEKNEYL